jgi:hypothetical protein
MMLKNVGTVQNSDPLVLSGPKNKHDLIASSKVDFHNFQIKTIMSYFCLKETTIEVGA